MGNSRGSDVMASRQSMSILPGRSICRHDVFGCEMARGGSPQADWRGLVVLLVVVGQLAMVGRPQSVQHRLPLRD